MDFRNQKTVAIQILILLILIDEGISGEFCITPTQTPGECLNIKQCPVLLNILIKERRDAREFLRSFLCPFQGNNPVVCCPTTTIIANNDRKSSSIETNNTVNYSPSSQDFLTPPHCGFSNVSHIRIVGGIPTEVGDWPWITALGYKVQQRFGQSTIKWLCGGTLVSSKHVLTAGHCVYNRPDLTLVRLGDLDLSSDDDGVNPVNIIIERAIIHPDYSPETYVNDIAVLKLRQNVLFTAIIHPICLPISDDIQNRNFAREFPFIAGWGSIEFRGPSSSHLQELQIPVVETSQCQKAFQKFKKAIIDQRVLCAGYARGGKDACQGDSGGPLMFPKHKTFYLIGIVSYGYKCAEPGFPGVYTRVTSFLDFIQKNMN